MCVDMHACVHEWFYIAWLIKVAYASKKRQLTDKRDSVTSHYVNHFCMYHLQMASSIGMMADVPEVDTKMTSSSLSTYQPPMSWQEIKQSVRKHHQWASMLSRVPQHFTLRTEQTPNGTIQRMYFLCTLVGSRENTLIYVDLPPPGTDPTSNVLEWRSLVDGFQQLPPSGPLSKEEQLLRERKRMRTLGITSYDYRLHEGSGHFAFSAGNRVFVCSDPLVDDLHLVSISELAF